MKAVGGMMKTRRRCTDTFTLEDVNVVEHSRKKNKKK